MVNIGIIFPGGCTASCSYMALRSVLAAAQAVHAGARRYTATRGLAPCGAGTARAYVLAFTTAGGSHRLQYPKPSAEQGVLPSGSDAVTLYYDPEAPEKMYVEGDQSVLGAEALYAVHRRGIAGADCSHCLLRGGTIENETGTFWYGRAGGLPAGIYGRMPKSLNGSHCTAEQAAPDAPQAEEDGLLTAAVNRTILERLFGPV